MGRDEYAGVFTALVWGRRWRTKCDFMMKSDGERWQSRGHTEGLGLGSRLRKVVFQKIAQICFKGGERKKMQREKRFGWKILDGALDDRGLSIGFLFAEQMPPVHPTDNG